MSIKVCSVCGKELIPNKNGHGMCQKCYHHWYYENNKEKIKAQAYKWGKENRDKRRVIEQRYRDNMAPEKKTAMHKRKWEQKKARMTPEDWENYHKKNRERYHRNKVDGRYKAARRRSRRNRRARETNTISDLTEKQWKNILKMFDHKCAYCGKPFNKLEQDHIIPVLNGGDTTLHNVVPSCRRCNLKKSTKPPSVPVQPVML